MVTGVVDTGLCANFYTATSQKLSGCMPPALRQKRLRLLLFLAEIGEAHDAGDAAAGLREDEHDDAGGGVV